MVKCCSAIGCASRCLPNSKLKGLTFHVFPTDENIKRKWVLAMKRLDVNAAGIWEPKKGDVLCSRHFKKTDFDRSAPNIKLKPGVIPSIFDSPSHLQGKSKKLHCRKNFTLKTLPVTNHNHQLVGASSCIEEFQSQFIFMFLLFFPIDTLFPIPPNSSPALLSMSIGYAVHAYKFCGLSLPFPHHPLF
ncbi:THAP domain-containing protein 6 isoform 4-T8 [Molossus nigricans]